MAKIRATFFFKNNEGLGWSETLFSTRATLVDARNDALLLIPKRVNLNGNDVFLYYLRVSDDEVKRDSEIFRVPKAAQNSKDPELGPSEDAVTALDVALKAGPTQRGTVFMSGIPDNIVTAGGAFTPTATWQANFAIWAAAVTGGPWGLKYRNTVAPFITITNMTQNGANGIVTVTTSAPHPFSAGDYVNVLQVGGATRARGVQKVIDAPTATTFTYRIKMIMQTYTGGGKCLPLVYLINAYTTAQVVRVGRHDRGVPFDHARGRRRVI